MSVMRPLLLAAMLVAFPAQQSRAQALPATPIDGIVAVVDEDVILRSELDLAVANVSHQIAASNPGQVPPRDVLERQVLERLVLMRLQVNRANDSGIRISDEELQQAVASIAQQNKMSVQDLRDRLAADHLSYDEFQSNLRDEVTVQRLRQRYVQSSVQISEAEIDQVLATTQVGGPEIHLANLQINVAEGATPEEVAAAKSKIDGIKAQVERGELDFRSAAIRYSQAQNALDGGDLGWRTGDSIPPVFATMLKSMKPGQITGIVRGPSGFQFVQLVESRDAQTAKITQYHAQDIMVAFSDVVPDELARLKIEALRDRITKGEDFAKVAKEASDDTQTRAAGGDMGWIAADAYGTAIGGQLRQLADGELSPVFKSDVGYHLVKRLATREQDVTDENRRNKAREIIGQRKAEEAYDRFLRQLRAEAYVDSRLGGA